MLYHFDPGSAILDYLRQFSRAESSYIWSGVDASRQTPPSGSSGAAVEALTAEPDRRVVLVQRTPHHASAAVAVSTAGPGWRNRNRGDRV